MVKEIGTSELIDVWATSGTREDAGSTKRAAGWNPTENPPSQWFNYEQNKLDKKINHVMNYGVILWNNSTPFPVGACVTHNGLQWRARNANTNSTPSLTNADWVALATVEDVNSIIPVGVIQHYLGSVAPSGWAFLEGQAISRVAYPILFSILGTSEGAGDGATTFNLPDLRGQHLRIWDNGKGVDPGRALRSFQSDAIKSHAHGGVPLFVGADSDRGGSSSAFSIDNVGSTASAGINENRVKTYSTTAIVRLG